MVSRKAIKGSSLNAGRQGKYSRSFVLSNLGATHSTNNLICWFEFSIVPIHIAHL